MLWHLFGLLKWNKTKRWGKNFIKGPDYSTCFIYFLIFKNIHCFLVPSKFLSTKHIVSLILYTFTSKVRVFQSRTLSFDSLYIISIFASGGIIKWQVFHNFFEFILVMLIISDELCVFYGHNGQFYMTETLILLHTNGH